MIESLQNSRIKDLTRLQLSRGRKQSGHFSVEGAREISRALSSKLNLISLFYCEQWLEKSQEARVCFEQVDEHLRIEVSKKIFAHCAVREEKDGLIAVFEQKKWKVEELIEKTNAPFLLAIDSLEKPGNLGAILRTCDASNVDGLILLGQHVDVWNPQAIRSSLGAIFSVPVFSLSDQEFIDLIEANAFSLVSLTPEANESCYDLDLVNAKQVVLLGSEAHGIRSSWKERSDRCMTIPMRSKLVDSLNVSVSAAVICFERLRQMS